MTEQEWRERFAKQLKIKMRNRNVDQRELARRINVSEISISRYRKARRTPPAHILVDMAIALECTVDELANFGELVE